jgi:hypothetical protein
MEGALSAARVLSPTQDIGKEGVRIMIPFPKIHIASSVLNRIFNTLEGEPQLAIPQPAPVPPMDPIVQGQQIDQALEQPPPPAAPAPGTEQQVDQSMETASAEGASPFDGALVGASSNAPY